MGFENPAYLWGTLAAFIPVVLHLIARRRARMVDFAAVEFILLSNKKIARRLKLKQWLLLLLRMLLIAAIPLAFAKPFLTRTESQLPVTDAGAPVSLVLVIDPSFSMGYEVGDESHLDLALEKAHAIVDDLRSESDAAIVMASAPARALTQRLTYDRRQLHDALRSIRQIDGTADMQGALRLAEQILVASSQPRREVVLLTDLQATEWEGIGRPWSLEHSPRVTLVDLRPTTDRQNAAITAVHAEPESGGMGRDVRVTVDILNDGPTFYQQEVTVEVGGKTTVGIVKVPPRQTVTKEFTVRLTEVGSHAGEVTIPADDLPGDNSQHFVVDFLRRVHVLVVNGAPRTVPHRDEVFFLRAALRPARESGSRMNPTYVKPDELTPAQLAYVDVVVLANVSELDDSQTTALVQWIHNGGGLLVTAGENVVAETYNGLLAPLIPLPVRDVRDAGAQPLFLTGVETNHPVLAIFSELPDASLFTARTARYVLLGTAAKPDTRVLASFTDGSPALVERQVGAGRILMLTTTIDRDWTDLPFKTSFLPLLQQAVLYLGGRLERLEQRSLVVGETRPIQVGRDVTEIAVTKPDGEVARFSGPDLATGEARFHATELAGIYEIRQLRRQGAEEEHFAVHVDPRESALAGADRDAVQVALESGQTTGGGTRVAERPQPERRGNLWPSLLIALFVLLGFETWLAYQTA